MATTPFTRQGLGPRALLWLGCLGMAASCEAAPATGGGGASGAGAPATNNSAGTGDSPASLGGAGAPASEAAGTGGAPSSCGDIPMGYLAPTCTFVVCHDGQSGNPLDLLAPGLPERLVGRESTSLNCAGFRYIDPAAPEQSLILRKLDADPPCGDRMPPAAMVTPTERACMLAWIRGAVELAGPP